MNVAGERAASRAGLLLGCVACGTAIAAEVQPFPTRIVRLVVPYPPGAANEILARGLAQRLAETFGHNVVVDTRPGAGGHIGGDIAARATPDGHTWLLGTSGTIAISPAVYQRLPYDPLRDLTPVTLFANIPYVIAAGLAAPPTLAALIAAARARPGQLAFASSGNASTPHLCGELLAQAAGVRLLHVPYKGGVQAVTDVISGQVQFYCGGIPTVLAQMRAGRLRSLGVTAASRSPLLPGESTVAEQGYPGFEVASWVGILVPAATPRATVDRIHSAIARVIAGTDMRQFVEAQGAEPVAVDPTAFAALVRAEAARWSALARSARISVD